MLNTIWITYVFLGFQIDVLSVRSPNGYCLRFTASTTAPQVGTFDDGKQIDLAFGGEEHQVHLYFHYLTTFEDEKKKVPHYSILSAVESNHKISRTQRLELPETVPVAVLQHLRIKQVVHQCSEGVGSIEYILYWIDFGKYIYIYIHIHYIEH